MTEVPDSGLLDEAAERMAELGLITGDRPRWEVLSTEELVRSTVRLMSVSAAGDAPVRVYHKTIKPRERSKKAEIVLQETRESLTVSFEMEERLAAHLPHPQVQIARTLAVDPERLESVTLAVPGEGLGALWRHRLTRSRRQRAHRAVHLVGVACREMEEHCTYAGDLHDRLRGEEVVDRRVGRVAPSLSSDTIAQVSALMVELERSAMGMDSPIVRVHGDLNSTNVLLHDQGIGLIDFGWQARLRHTDLAHFAFRLEYESGSPPRFSSDLVQSLLDGFGDREVTTGPAWRFLRYSKLIRVVGSGEGSIDPRARWRARRARDELRREMGISTR